MMMNQTKNWRNCCEWDWLLHTLVCIPCIWWPASSHCICCIKMLVILFQWPRASDKTREGVAARSWPCYHADQQCWCGLRAPTAGVFRWRNSADASCQPLSTFLGTALLTFVSICVCVCVRAHVWVCACVCVYECMCVCVCICVSVFFSVHMLYVHISMCVCVCACVRACACFCFCFYFIFKYCLNTRGKNNTSNIGDLFVTVCTVLRLHLSRPSMWSSFFSLPPHKWV